MSLFTKQHFNIIYFYIKACSSLSLYHRVYLINILYILSILYECIDLLKFNFAIRSLLSLLYVLAVEYSPILLVLHIHYKSILFQDKYTVLKNQACILVSLLHLLVCTCDLVLSCDFLSSAFTGCIWFDCIFRFPESGHIFVLLDG